MPYYDEFLATLASESRLAILGQLVSREMTVSELIEEMGMSQSAVSHQLAFLRRAGFSSRSPGRSLDVLYG